MNITRLATLTTIPIRPRCALSTSESGAQYRIMSTSTSTPFIVGYYDPKIQRQDAEGRTLDETLHFSDNQLEYYHDYIQYLFPLPERSPINPRAPVITKDVREAFLARQDLRDQLQRSLDRMLGFYGFTSTSSTTTNSDQPRNNNLDIQPSPNFSTQASQTWRKRFDHNHLRITRIIRSLRVLGLEGEARAFRSALVENDQPQKVSERSRMFWERAAERALRLAPQEEDEGARGVSWLAEEG